MNKDGNKGIVEAGKSSRFNSETARAAQLKAAESKHRKASTFKLVAGFTDDIVPDDELDPNIKKFYAMKGISSVTYMMKELAPIWLDAQKGGDFATLMQIYKLLGITFDSKREQNINLSVGNKDDKPFEFKIVMEGDKDD